MIIEEEFGKIEIIEENNKEPIDNLKYILYKLQNEGFNISIIYNGCIFNKFKLPINSYLIKFSINKQIMFCYNTYKSNVEEEAYYCDPGEYSAKFYFENNRFIIKVIKNDNK